MSFTLKVVFDDKIVVIASKIESLSQISEEIQARLKRKLNQPFIVKYHDKIIENIQELHFLQKQCSNKILKVNAFQAHNCSLYSDKSSNSLENLKYISQQIGSKISSIHESSSKFINNSSFICPIDHEQKHKSKQKQISMQEKMIQGSQYLVVDQFSDSQNNELIIDEIKCEDIQSNECENLQFCDYTQKIVEKKVQQKMNQLLKNYALIPKQDYPKYLKMKQNQEKKIKKDSKMSKIYKLVNKESQVSSSNLSSKFDAISIIQNPDNKKGVIEDIHFLWEFKIKIPPHLKTHQIQIIDLQNGNKKIVTNEDVLVGPYIANKTKVFERNFRLGYQKDGITQFIGNQFGFKVPVINVKQQKVSQMKKQYLKYVELCIKKYNSNLSLKQVSEKLAYIGVNDKNYKDSKQIIIELINNL